MSTFHLFSRLPSEIRLKVWEFAAFQPRLVVMLDAEETDKHTMHGFKSFTPPPSTMQVCHESRTVALKYYKKALNQEERYIWINFDVDTLQVDSNFLGWDFPGHRDVKHITAVTDQYVDDYAFGYNFDIEDYPNLKTLDVVVVPLQLPEVCRSMWDEWCTDAFWKNVAVRMVQRDTGEYITPKTAGSYQYWHMLYKVKTRDRYSSESPFKLSVEQRAACPSQFLADWTPPVSR